MSETEDAPLSGVTFLREYFAGACGNIFIGCYRNADSKKREGEVAKLLPQTAADVDHFIDTYDRPELETAIYYCTATLRNGHDTRKAEDCWEFISLFADIDDNNHDLSWQQAIAALEALPLPPTLVVNSGHGLQPHWLLTTPSEDFKRVGELRRKLQSILASDSVPDAPRLMRLPGSHNSKFGNWLPVEVVRRAGIRYTIDELTAWLDAAGVIIPAKEKAKANGQGRPGDTVNNDAPVDVDRRLATMRYQGASGSSIHQTKLTCTAALLNAANPVEDVVDKVDEAVRRAVDGDPRAAGWDWDEERYDTEAMCYSLINKDPSLAPTLPERIFDERCRQLEAGNADPKIVYDRQRKRWHVEQITARTTGAPSTPAWPTPYSARPSLAIPRRKWLWGKHYLRGEVTITAAPGATGKSQHSLIEAVGMAAGRDLVTGEVKAERLRVWVWNAEDDVDEQERRVAGICEHYSIDRESLRGWLFLDSGYAVPLEFAAGGKVAIIKENVLRAVAERVKALKIDVVIFDPLIALHSLPEADNTNLGKVIRALGTCVAKPCGCAIELVHHTRKAGKGDDSGLVADDMRGASTIVYTPRSGRLMHPMSPAEAEKYGIDGEDRMSYVRLERAKPNMARRGTIYWVQLIIHALDNAGENEPADSVSVPVLWTPVDVTSKITDAATASIGAAIAKGNFRRDVRAGNDWAGRVIGKACNLDLSNRWGRTQAEAILSKLIAKGVLATEFRTEPRSRKTREYVIKGGTIL